MFCFKVLYKVKIHPEQHWRDGWKFYLSWNTWKTSGKHLGNTWETLGKHPGNTRETLYSVLFFLVNYTVDLPLMRNLLTRFPLTWFFITFLRISTYTIFEATRSCIPTPQGIQSSRRGTTSHSGRRAKCWSTTSKCWTTTRCKGRKISNITSQSTTTSCTQSLP